MTAYGYKQMSGARWRDDCLLTETGLYPGLGLTSLHSHKQSLDSAGSPLADRHQFSANTTWPTGIRFIIRLGCADCISIADLGFSSSSSQRQVFKTAWRLLIASGTTPRDGAVAVSPDAKMRAISKNLRHRPAAEQRTQILRQVLIHIIAFGACSAG